MSGKRSRHQSVVLKDFFAYHFIYDDDLVPHRDEPASEISHKLRLAVQKFLGDLNDLEQFRHDYRRDIISMSNLKTSDEAIKTDEMMMKVVPLNSHSTDGPESSTQVSSMHRVQLLIVYMLDVSQGSHSRIRTRCF